MVVGLGGVVGWDGCRVGEVVRLEVVGWRVVGLGVL